MPAEGSVLPDFSGEPYFVAGSPFLCSWAEDLKKGGGENA